MIDTKQTACTKSQEFRGLDASGFSDKENTEMFVFNPLISNTQNHN